MKQTRFQISRIHRLKTETNELTWIINEAIKLGMHSSTIAVMRKELRTKKAKYMKALTSIATSTTVVLFKATIKDLLKYNFLVKVKLEMKKGQDQTSILI